MQEFTYIASRSSIREEGLATLDKNAKLIIQLSFRMNEKYLDTLTQDQRDMISPWQVYPKMHFLLHYSDLIRRFGPIVLTSAIRVERKHYDFKMNYDMIL